MNIQKLKEKIIFEEGVKTKAYRCPSGYWTIGIGHNLETNPLTANQCLDLKILSPNSLKNYNTGNYEEFEVDMGFVDKLFISDIDNTLRDVKSLFHNINNYPENVQVVLADMCFNIGLNKLIKFRRMRDCINNMDWQGMINEIEDSLYYRQFMNYNPVDNRALRNIKMIEEIL